MSGQRDRTRVFTNVVLAVVPCAAMSAAHAEPDPEPFPYDETTTVLVEAFGEHLRPPGLPPDWLVSDALFIDWFVAYSQDVPLLDYNGDNLIDCMDIVDITVALLNAMRGDLNGDGVVNEADAAILTANMGQALHPDGPPVLITDGDLTAGYSVTMQDLEALMTRHGQVLDNFAHVVAMQLVFERPKSVCFENEWVAHNAFFSGSWPPLWPPTSPPGHTQVVSHHPKQPPGHHYEITRTWPGTAPAPDIPPPLPRWPPNHNATMSNTWDHDHSAFVSSKWPPSHIAWLSGGWEQHSYDVSGAWGPNHRSEITTSGPVHIQDASVMIWPRSPHLQGLSSTDPPNHNADHSQAWPPNHDGFVTNTWSPTHSANTSVHWPAGHFYQVSAEWPPNVNPVWPPNHTLGQSRTWGQPPPAGPGWWPSDHAYVTTILDILDVILPTP